MKATKATIDRAVDRPDPAVRFYLFQGEDQAQSRALAARLLESLGSTKAALSVSDLKAEAALLADEAAALSLFGERRLIWIEPATNEIADAVDSLLGAPNIESPVVAIAGALPKTSALRKTAELSPHAVAFAAYAPDGDDAARMVADLGRRVGLEISRSTAARIAESCANDQAIALRELEKFALYVDASPQAPKELHDAVLDELAVDGAEGDVLRLGDMALIGDVGALSAALARLPAGSSAAVPAVRALQRRLLTLAPARARVEGGERPHAVVTSLGKSLFWKEKDTVTRMLELWSAEDLSTLVERAGALEHHLMFSDAPEQDMLGEELLAIARRAHLRRR